MTTLLTTNLPTLHDLTRSFASWYVARANSQFPADNIRRVTVQLWAQANQHDLNEDGIAHIYEHWSEHVEIVPN